MTKQFKSTVRTRRHGLLHVERLNALVAKNKRQLYRVADLNMAYLRDPASGFSAERMAKCDADDPRPVVVNRHGDVLDGRHRLLKKVDRGDPAVECVVASDAQIARARTRGRGDKSDVRMAFANKREYFTRVLHLTFYDDVGPRAFKLQWERQPGLKIVVSGREVWVRTSRKDVLSLRQSAAKHGAVVEDNVMASHGVACDLKELRGNPKRRDPHAGLPGGAVLVEFPAPHQAQEFAALCKKVLNLDAEPSRENPLRLTIRGVSSKYTERLQVMAQRSGATVLGRDVHVGQQVKLDMLDPYSKFGATELYRRRLKADVDLSGEKSPLPRRKKGRTAEPLSEAERVASRKETVYRANAKFRASPAYRALLAKKRAERAAKRSVLHEQWNRREPFYGYSFSSARSNAWVITFTIENSPHREEILEGFKDFPRFTAMPNGVCRVEFLGTGSAKDFATFRSLLSKVGGRILSESKPGMRNSFSHSIACDYEEPLNTRRDIVREVANDLGVTQGSASPVVRAALQKIVDALIKNGRVELRGFGVFELKWRKAKWGTNPNKGNQAMRHPSQVVVVFKPSSKVKARLPREGLSMGSNHDVRPGSHGGYYWYDVNWPSKRSTRPYDQTFDKAQQAKDDKILATLRQIGEVRAIGWDHNDDHYGAYVKTYLKARDILDLMRRHGAPAGAYANRVQDGPDDPRDDSDRDGGGHGGRPPRVMPSGPRHGVKRNVAVSFSMIDTNITKLELYFPFARVAQAAAQWLRQHGCKVRYREGNRQVLCRGPRAVVNRALEAYQGSLVPADKPPTEKESTMNRTPHGRQDGIEPARGLVGMANEPLTGAVSPRPPMLREQAEPAYDELKLTFANEKRARYFASMVARHVKGAKLHSDGQTVKVKYPARASALVHRVAQRCSRQSKPQRAMAFASGEAKLNWRIPFVKQKMAEAAYDRLLAAGYKPPQIVYDGKMAILLNGVSTRELEEITSKQLILGSKRPESHGETQRTPEQIFREGRKKSPYARLPGQAGQVFLRYAIHFTSVAIAAKAEQAMRKQGIDSTVLDPEGNLVVGLRDVLQRVLTSIAQRYGGKIVGQATTTTPPTPTAPPQVAAPAPKKQTQGAPFVPPKPPKLPEHLRTSNRRGETYNLKKKGMAFGMWPFGSKEKKELSPEDRAKVDQHHDQFVHMIKSYRVWDNPKLAKAHYKIGKTYKVKRGNGHDLHTRVHWHSLDEEGKPNQGHGDMQTVTTPWDKLEEQQIHEGKGGFDESKHKRDKNGMWAAMSHASMGLDSIGLAWAVMDFLSDEVSRQALDMLAEAGIRATKRGMNHVVAQVRGSKNLAKAREIATKLGGKFRTKRANDGTPASMGLGEALGRMTLRVVGPMIRTITSAISEKGARLIEKKVMVTPKGLAKAVIVVEGTRQTLKDLHAMTAPEQAASMSREGTALVIVGVATVVAAELALEWAMQHQIKAAIRGGTKLVVHGMKAAKAIAARFRGKIEEPQAASMALPAVAVVLKFVGLRIAEAVAFYLASKGVEAVANAAGEVHVKTDDPEEVALAKRVAEKKGGRVVKQAASMAKYPWNQCVTDQTKRYGSQKIAQRVCGKIKAKAASQTPAMLDRGDKDERVPATLSKEAAIFEQCLPGKIQQVI